MRIFKMAFDGVAENVKCTHAINSAGPNERKYRLIPSVALFALGSKDRGQALYAGLPMTPYKKGEGFRFPGQMVRKHTLRCDA